MSFIQDRAYEDWSYAARFFCNQILGKDIGDTEVSLWGSQRDLLEGSIGTHKKIKHWLFHLTRLNTFFMDDRQMASYIEAITREKPVMLAGYVDSLFEVARFVQKQGMEPFQPWFVLSQAGTLTELARRTISEAFRAPVYNFYGSREISAIACECSHRSLHILSSGRFVEVVDVQNGWGDLIVTCLTNYSMPFIRYRIGDKGALRDGECTCGRGFPLLRSVAGRAAECFRTRDGRIIPPQYLIDALHILCNDGLIGKFQFVQRDFDDVVVRMVSDGQNENLERKIRNRLQLVMGENCRIDFEIVDNILPQSSGKYLYTISDVGVPVDSSYSILQ